VRTARLSRSWDGAVAEPDRNAAICVQCLAHNVHNVWASLAIKLKVLTMGPEPLAPVPEAGGSGLCKTRSHEK